MNAVLTKYLKDFSVPETPAVEDSLVSSLADLPFGELEPDFPSEPEFDIEEERGKARQEGYLEAVEDLETRHAESLAAMREAHATVVADIEERHDRETIGVIHQRFQDMTETLANGLAEQTLKVLLPVLDEAVTRNALETLADHIRTAILREKAATVVVHGPERLREPLFRLFDADEIDIRFDEQDTLDLTVEVDETVFLTRLGQWAQSLSEVNE